MKFRKGCKKPHTDKTKKQLLEMSQNRVMITFKDKEGYNLLLNDEKQLLRLKETSYLDMDHLAKEKAFRVHLYYDTTRTRYTLKEIRS
jgi:hypothetical protein